VNWFGGSWFDEPEFLDPEWFSETGEVAPAKAEFFGGSGWIGIPKVIRKWIQLPIQWLTGRGRKRPPAAPEQPPAGLSAEAPPAPLPSPPPEIILSFAKYVQQVKRKRQRDALRALQYRVNDLRRELGMPKIHDWGKRIAFPEGLRYYYLSRRQLLVRVLREELKRLQEARRQAA
jgi:hypothetical protein